MSKEISISTILDDDKSEANESFYLRMNKGATGETLNQVYDKVTITQPTGMLGTQLLGGNSGALAGTDTVVTAASKTIFRVIKMVNFSMILLFQLPPTQVRLLVGKYKKVEIVLRFLPILQQYQKYTVILQLCWLRIMVPSFHGVIQMQEEPPKSDGLTTISTLGSNGALTLGGASTSAGSATFSKGNKVTITSEGDDSGAIFG